MNPLMFISSDGHATAKMEEYRPYLDAHLREEFDEFCEMYRKNGTIATDPASLRGRLDDDEVDKWIREVVEPGRLAGIGDPGARLRQLESEGICAEVLFPDAGMPFVLNNLSVAATMKPRPRTREQVDGANRAYNRWLVDFCSHAPQRFAGMALIDFVDIDAAMKEIRWIKEAGLKGVIAPQFDESLPLFDAIYDPIWSLLEELDLPLNTHVGLSATSTNPLPPVNFPHMGVARKFIAETLGYYCRLMLEHLIWGGVLERHPNLKVVITEQGSGWIPEKLKAMDYSYSHSYMRRDIREFVKHSPSEYFQRQGWIGSSLLSRAEVEHRQEIGVDKMMVGADYPHHEGMWHGPNVDYLQATFGGTGVSVAEVRQMLGENIAAVFGFDVDALAPLAERIGPMPEQVLVAPIEDRFPRGDVHKPVGV